MPTLTRSLYPALALGLAVVSGVMEFVALRRVQQQHRERASA